jgi:monoamine oxidase
MKADRWSDVIVVGGGFAGVTAARDLGYRGLSVMILEARERIGGRAWADRRLGRLIELGGNFMHWSNPFMWREVQRHGLRITRGLAQTRVYWVTGGELRSSTPSEVADLLAPAMSAMVSDACERFPYPYDVFTADIATVDQESFSSRFAKLDVTDEQRDLINAVNAYGSQNPDLQSVSQLLRLTSLYSGDWRVMFEAGDTWRLESGTTSLVHAIAAEASARILLSTPVASIDDTGDAVRVISRAGDEYAGRAVIVAVPVNAMAAIEFASGLPAPADRLIRAGHSNRGFKLWARVRGEVEAFRAHVPYGQGPLNFAMTEYRVDGDTLVVAFGGNDSDLDMTDGGAVEQALRRFVPDLEVVAVDGHDWSSDEFAQGTWVMLDRGQLADCIPTMQRAHGRVWFAGGDIAKGFPSWMDGAIESGTLTAKAVADVLVPPVTSLV